MTELLIGELRRKDSCEKVTFPRGFSREKFKHMVGYKTFLKNLDYRDLTSPEKLKVMQNIQLSSLLPGDQNSEKLQLLWGEFIVILGDLKLNFATDEAIDQLKVKIEGWFKNFLSLQQAKDVTPYACPIFSRS